MPRPLILPPICNDDDDLPVAYRTNKSIPSDNGVDEWPLAVEDHLFKTLRRFAPTTDANELITDVRTDAIAWMDFKRAVVAVDIVGRRFPELTSDQQRDLLLWLLSRTHKGVPDLGRHVLEFADAVENALLLGMTDN